MKINLAICICTYKRPKLLENLLRDIISQTLLPNCLVVVDGDPESGEIKCILKRLEVNTPISILYIPSNHSNLPYQRFLGWKSLKNSDYDILFYFDDDIRIKKSVSVLDLVTELMKTQEFVGGTARLNLTNEKNLDINNFRENKKNYFLNKLIDSSKYEPGDLTPAGHRVLPSIENHSIAEVKWLCGGLMAFKKNALFESDFSADLFAMYENKIGKAEDTYLSRQALRYGKLMFLDIKGFEHPSDSPPIAYPTKMKKLGAATAYSRRFLNDHYRIIRPPCFSDRLKLSLSYIGNNLINIIHAFHRHEKQLYAYAWGYFLGSVKGIFQKPDAESLTPNIDWWADAKWALSQIVKIR